jgi:hypothetical protein
MKLNLSIGLPLFLCLGAAFCSAQCADGFDEQELTCAGPNGCEQTVTVYYPEESQSGVVVRCTAINCCAGDYETTCYSYGNCEPVKALKDLDVQRRLAQLAGESEVLVAECSGLYTPYTPPPPIISARRSMPSASDHSLR